MCAIYKYGNDDALRVNVFFLLSVQFGAFCFLPILAATIWCAWFCPFRLLLIIYVLSRIFSFYFFHRRVFYASHFYLAYTSLWHRFLME